MKLFSDSSLPAELQRAVAELGFSEPTPVQQAVIPFLLAETRDLIALAQTGTGKTAAYGLPLLSRVLGDDPRIRGLVICPTRELCNQITADLQAYARLLPDVRIVAVYGGASVGGQIQALKRGARIVVATPGRLVDLGERGAVDLSAVETVVLDEADEMMDMGFQDELNAILERTPAGKRTWVFSATLPDAVRHIAGRYLHDPHEIAIGRRNAGAENIEHLCFRIREKDRTAALKRIVDHHPEIYGLIFCRTREETRRLAEELIQDGYNADALHGDLAQTERDKVMRRFKERSLQLLVATDVAARGLDVEDLSHVIHYRLPDSAEAYVHRSGRTARAGKSGVSIAFVNLREERRRREIEQGGGFHFRFQLIPSGDDVCEQQLVALARRLSTVEVPEADIARFLPPVYAALAGIDREELIRRVLALEFERVVAASREAPDLNPGQDHTPRDAWEPRSKRNEEKMVRLAIDVGGKDGVPAGGILRFICAAAGVKSRAIGRIDIRYASTIIDVRPDEADKVFQGIQGGILDRRPVRVRYWDESGRKRKPAAPVPRDARPPRPAKVRPENVRPARERKERDLPPRHGAGKKPHRKGEKPTRPDKGFAGKKSRKKPRPG